MSPKDGILLLALASIFTMVGSCVYLAHRMSVKKFGVGRVRPIAPSPLPTWMFWMGTYQFLVTVPVIDVIKNGVWLPGIIGAAAFGWFFTAVFLTQCKMMFSPRKLDLHKWAFALWLSALPVFVLTYTIGQETKPGFKDVENFYCLDILQTRGLIFTDTPIPEATRIDSVRADTVWVSVSDTTVLVLAAGRRFAEPQIIWGSGAGANEGGPFLPPGIYRITYMEIKPEHEWVELSAGYATESEDRTVYSTFNL